MPFRMNALLAVLLRACLVVGLIVVGAAMAYWLLSRQVVAEQQHIASTTTSGRTAATAPGVPVAPAPAKPAPSTASPDSASPPVLAAKAAPAAALATKANSCSIAAYSGVGAPTLAPGFSKQIDPATYYITGTDSPSQLVAQVNACAKHQPALGGYAAITSYRLNWSYGVENSSPTECRLSDVRVAVRINQLLPTIDAGRPTSVTTKWNAIAGKLYAHENEHTAIDVAHASQLYSQLSALSAPCGKIQSQANQLTSASSSAIRAANSALDAATGHGAL